MLNHPYNQPVTLKTIVAYSICIIASLAGFMYIAHHLQVSGVFSYDVWIMDWREQVTISSERFMEVISTLGSVSWMGVAFLVVMGVLWIVYRSWKPVFFFSLTMGGGIILNMLLKQIYQRGRPEEVESLEVFGVVIEAASYSFPSGHTMRAFIFYGFLIVWVLFSSVRPWVKAVFTFLLANCILWVGASRVFLEAHYLSDILAGYLVSLAWLLICLFSYRLWLSRQQGKDQPSFLK